MVGFFVGFVTKGQGGIPYQVIVAIFTMFGIMLGKYLGVFFIAKHMIEQQYGGVAANSLQLFSSDFFLAFIGALQNSFDPKDLLWLMLAIISAWQMLAVKKEPMVQKGGEVVEEK